MATKFPITSLLLQGDADAAGYTINNLNLSGLNLTKNSVGLGNVDNTADVNKPLSTAMVIALGDKEGVIAYGTTGQFWRGDKTWQNFGALALQDGVTSLSLISTIASAANTSAILRANRHDTASSVSIRHLGESTVGSAFPGVTLANAGYLAFDGVTNAIIRTNTLAPIHFGYNNVLRMRLRLGLDMGNTVSDPGAGCINAYGTITAGEFVGPGSGITGLVKGQIPAVLNVTTFPSLTINGEVGAGYVEFGAQTATPAPASALALIYADTAGQLSFINAATATAVIFNNSALSANRTYSWPNASGAVVIGNTDTGWTAWTGTGSKATKLVSTATTAEIAAAVKSIIDALIANRILGA